jgi:hypothetical protein
MDAVNVRWPDAKPPPAPGCHQAGPPIEDPTCTIDNYQPDLQDVMAVNREARCLDVNHGEPHRLEPHVSAGVCIDPRTVIHIGNPTPGV